MGKTAGGTIADYRLPASGLSIIAFWIWAIVIEFFDSSQGIESQFAEKVLVVLLILVLPVLGIIIGTVKFLRELGVYLYGIRVSNGGVEIGMLTMGGNSGISRNIWEKHYP